MMFRSKHWAAYVRIFCAIALLFVGFAHKPPQISTASLSPAELASLVLPDGTLPDLCLPGHEDEGSGLPHGTMGSGCEACRLASSIVMPSPPVSFGEPMALVIAVLEPPRNLVIFDRHFSPNTAPRAPPHIILSTAETV